MRCLQRCGGDLDRIIDGPAASIDGFGRHVARLSIVRTARELPLVVLTRTNPLAMNLVGARRALEAAVPSLARALWLVFFDPTHDPFFVDTARRLGHLDGDVGGAPLWSGPDGFRFLVLGPQVADLDVLPHRIADLVQSSLASSAVVERGAREPSAVSAAVGDGFTVGRLSGVAPSDRRSDRRRRG